ncbi:MAG: 2-oxoacid:acceptor oxidoreductase family protein [Thermodesulfobacteriota bacterium]|nr:2-oxoacid:acceptor oxidoreductase family protein [Thermodesulfobacteriota bacterium]
MPSILEIRWHSRGGQGAMLAVRTLARAVIRDGKYAQGLPEFGPERMGAPIRAYNRISDQPFALYCAIINPHIIVILDPSVAKLIDVTEGMYDDSKVIVNTDISPTEIREKLNIPKGKGKIYAIDALKISQQELGRPMPNTPIMGALVKVASIISFDALLGEVEKEFSERFPKKIVEANLTAIRRGYEEVVEE